MRDDRTDLAGHHATTGISKRQSYQMCHFDYHKINDSPRSVMVILDLSRNLSSFMTDQKETA